MLRRRASVGMGLLGAALAASSAGCAEDSVSIVPICPAIAEEENGTCIVSPDGDTCVRFGEWNLFWKRGYEIGIRLQSGLQPRESEVPVRAETNDVHVTELVVTLRNPAGAVLKGDAGHPNPYTLKVAGIVPAGGLGIVSAVLIPETYVGLIRGKFVSGDPLLQVVADVEIRGKTAGTEEVVVAPWQWPIFLHDRDNGYKSRECWIPETPVCSPGQDGVWEVCNCPPPIEDNCPPAGD